MSSEHISDPAAYIPSVLLSDYSYDLPDDRIAPFPLQQRDASRLLVCDVRDSSIHHRSFGHLPALIPDDAMMVLNDTRVVRARIVMYRPTGGRVEIFLLDPVEPSHDPAIALAAHCESVWICMIGGARKVAGGGELHGTFGDNGNFSAVVEEREEDGFRVRFRWQPEDLTFAEVLESVGRIPLPPYIKRDATDEDAATYQTVYAEQEGAVAAPTAGLHFTQQTLDALQAKGVQLERVTLHVGAGTFKQVKEDDVTGHQMHQERIAVGADTLRAMIAHAERRMHAERAPFVIVGTTSLRTVESLYWFGARLLAGDTVDNEELAVEQWDPYRLATAMDTLPDLPEALHAVDRWRNGREIISGRTRILIVPGYRFRCCDALVTNFHQPGSTLILLVGAFLGRELWEQAYGAALSNGYRFLSYGDSSLLIRDRF